MTRLRRTSYAVVVAALIWLVAVSQVCAKLNGATLAFAPGSGSTPTIRGGMLELAPGQRFTTEASELRELLLPDGSGLTLGAESEVVLEVYEYDPEQRTGKMEIRVERGMLRIVGGAIHSRTRMLIHTPVTTLELENGAALLEVDSNGRTRASLLFGRELRMTSGGKTKTLVRPGFELVSARASEPPTGPARQARGAAERLIAALSTGRLATQTGSAQEIASNAGQNQAIALGSSIVALVTQEQPAGRLTLPSALPSPALGAPPMPPLEALPVVSPEQPPSPALGAPPVPTPGAPPVALPEQPPSPAPGAPGFEIPGRPTPIGNALTGSEGFGPGTTLAAIDLNQPQPTQANGDSRLLAQARGVPVFENSTVSEPTRAQGRTTNLFFNSGAPFTQVLTGGANQDPRPVTDMADSISRTPVTPPDPDLGYVFFNDSGLSLALDRVRALGAPDRQFFGGFDTTAPFLLLGIQLPSPGGVFQKDIPTIVSQNPLTFDSGVGSGASIFTNGTHFKLLQAGFSTITNPSGGGGDSVTRADDNFLLAEVRPGQVVRRVRDELKDRLPFNGTNIRDPILFLSRIDDNGSITTIRTRSSVFHDTSQVNTIAGVILQQINSLGLTSNDVKGPNDPGYNNYLSRIAPLIGALGMLSSNSNIGPSLVEDIRIAFEGLVGTFFVDNPKVKIDELKVLTLMNGQVNDPIAFIKALGVSPDLKFTFADVNALARQILGSNVAPAAELTVVDLTTFNFLSESDRITIATVVNRILSTGLDPDRTERFLFATGNLDSRLKPTFTKRFSVDRFFLSAGLENFAQKDQGRTIADGIRAFLRRDTGLHLPLADTGLLVVNTGSTRADAQDAFLHADFGLAGTGSGQQSTISVTLGNVAYQVKRCDTCDIKDSVEAVATGQTIGSSRGTITTRDANGVETRTNEATVAFSSPIRSTATGGGNPALRNPDGSVREGYAGYFVLGNFDPVPQDVQEPPLLGGTERPLGGTQDTRYAYLRLATAIGSSLSGEVQIGTRSALSLSGWAAGLAEVPSAGRIGVTQIDTDVTTENFTLRTDPVTNRAEARVALFNHPTLQFGGLSGMATQGQSAFLDDNQFAARTGTGANVEMALISGELVKAGLPPDMQNLIRKSSGEPYQYLKWGFFFGDVTTTGGEREHIHLGTWVAGQQSDLRNFPSVGTATYSGHAIGNVLTNNSLYTAVGSYQNAWNFGTRTGTVNMSFDGTGYTGDTRLRDSSVHFDGVLRASNRTGGLHGNFIQGGTDAAAGVIGRFSIREATGAPTYRASGTFGAER